MVRLSRTDWFGSENQRYDPRPSSISATIYSMTDWESVPIITAVSWNWLGNMLPLQIRCVLFFLINKIRWVSTVAQMFRHRQGVEQSHSMIVAKGQNTLTRWYSDWSEGSWLVRRRYEKPPTVTCRVVNVKRSPEHDRRCVCKNDSPQCAQFVKCRDRLRQPRWHLQVQQAVRSRNISNAGNIDLRS